ncbi:Coatomer protein complex subunit beta 1 [Paragonimus heterotremus]|uniref:Coatomer protein complex subunit beta 1 n=1 Tax=Paragonimus heterotremus TaxID=100268 RepID=A0A8J4WMC6_9TREM|nr:Coatomer protein complex subunit beta 1 [Paragonimus heterotremus]
MAGEQICYTLIGLSPEAKSYSEQQLKDDLQHSSVDVKREALKEVIRLIINGEKFPNLLMTVIRFVMPSQDHIIKKLLLLFWEVVPKYGPDGKLLHEMILVCDAYRKDLQHPNEFIRGSTLRFLCKLKEPELLEPLMPAIQQCLEHRHAYVRRNAVLAIFTIYKNFEHLIPDAPEKILQFLEQEQDASCKRNAFMMLVHVSQSSALEYLVDRLDQVQNFGDILQLIIVELIYKVCHQKPSERLRFIRCVYSLLQSSSPAVRYEAAGTLITLSSAPSALKAAASCYVNLILKESDNNVKLIVLSRLTDLRQYHERILQDLVMDIVQILAASDMEIRQKTLDLTMDLVTSRSADELIKLYRKELLKACNGNGAGGGSRVASAIASSTTGSGSSSKTAVGSVTNSDEANYRYALVHTIYDIAIRFPETLSTIIPTVCDILTYEEMGDSRAATEACRFLREVCQRYGQRKSEVLEKLVQVFPNVSGQETLRHIIWIFGEFCTTSEEINACITLFPPARSVAKAIKRPVLQAALFESAYMPAVVLSACLVKLYYRFKLAISEPVKHDLPTDEESKHRSVEARENAFCAECMLIIASMLHLANSGLLPHQINPDHLDRMWICLKVRCHSRFHYSNGRFFPFHCACEASEE